VTIASKQEHKLSITNPLCTYSKHKQSPKLFYTTKGVYTSRATKFCTLSPYTLGPQYETCLKSPLWVLEFGDGSVIAENLWAPTLQSVANMIVHTWITSEKLVMVKTCSKLTLTHRFALNIQRMNKHHTQTIHIWVAWYWVQFSNDKAYAASNYGHPCTALFVFFPPLSLSIFINIFLKN
jgi:hypothetical protein